MPTITFKISDSQKHQLLWALLNPEYNEEGSWAVEYGICEIYEEYAIVMNYAENKYQRIYYAKNDETDSFEITNREDCYIIDVSASEMEALKRLHEINGNTYAAVDANFERVQTELETSNNLVATLQTDLETVKTENSEFSTKIGELGNEITTLNIDKDTINGLYTEVKTQLENANSALAAANSTIESITTERDELATYKKNIVDTEKTTLINGYADQLEQAVLDTYLDNLDKYTLEQLDMELTYKQKMAHPEIFSKTPAAATYIPTNITPPASGLETLLAKYERK